MELLSEAEAGGCVSRLLGATFSSLKNLYLLEPQISLLRSAAAGLHSPEYAASSDILWEVE